jgi:hypothetical protein
MKTLFDKTERNSLVQGSLLIRNAMLEMMSAENERMTEQLFTFYQRFCQKAVPWQSKGNPDRLEIAFIASRVTDHSGIEAF